ncbi:FAD-dependent monooxygenase [Kitasatospora sp. NPDC056138]|uniref:FAD-dependent monooxygenase n=1 Tax=Kitasatospora sp. NPDC056138 TaxID=3345724 RepID=UPI0035DBB89F
MNALPESTDVVIVGAGPAGLALAVALADQQVDFVLLDRQAEGANTSRASMLHARTLEVLEEFGVTERLVSRGLALKGFALHGPRRPLVELSFAGLPTAHPYILMLPQNDSEEILATRLRELGGTVRRPYRVTGLDQDGDGVDVTVQGPDGTPARIRARYVVGTDGMHSTVREQAGIGFTGGTYRQSFVLADIRMSWPLGRAQAGLLLDPAGLVFVAPLPDGRGGDRRTGERFRVVAVVDEAPAEPDAAYVQRLLDTRWPTGARVAEVRWSSRFRVHHRVADRYRAGRLLLAGDAAHVHSPAGGQGMNTGIQDAVALGRALTEVLGGGAPDSRLDAYEATRRPVARQVVALTDRITRMATLRGAAPRAVRDTALRALGSIPTFRRRMATELAELHY